MRTPISRSAGFTLIELLAVIAIIALLANLTMPMISQMQAKARSIRCGSNLRQLGVAVQSYAADNDGRIPKIETDPSDPVYVGQPDVKGLLDTLGKYGATASLVQCPDDVAGKDYYKTKGSSYEWRPFIDDEPAGTPSLILPWGRGQQMGSAIPVSPSSVRLLTDWDSVHLGKKNAVYADGHVRISQ